MPEVRKAVPAAGASSLVSALAMKTIASVWDPAEGDEGAMRASARLIRDPVRSSEDSNRHLRRLTSSGIVDEGAAFGAADTPPPPTPPLSPGRSRHIPGVNSPVVFATPVGGGSTAGAAAMSRQMSMRSMETMTVLFGLETKIDKLASKIRDSEAELTVQVGAESRRRLRGSVAQLWGDLERVQFEGIDAVLIAELRSGKDAARDLRRSLTKRIAELTSRLENLKTQLDDGDTGHGDDMHRMI